MTTALHQDDIVRCDYFGGCPNHEHYHVAIHPESGWFLTKDGKAFCPLHIPKFAGEWRRRPVEDD